MSKKRSGELAPYRPLELMLDSKMTKSDFSDFIGVWPNFVPGSFCDQLIEYGENFLEERSSCLVGNLDSPDGTEIMDGATMYGGQQNRSDKSFLINYASDTWTIQVNQMLKACMLHYTYMYSQLKNVGLVSSDIKFQRTNPGGGYHLYHYENAHAAFSQREVTWMIYLNDIEEGGETEFQYQKRRIKPTKGTVVVFPAGYTHVHKGNLVMGDRDKYIVTGWYIKSGS